MKKLLYIYIIISFIIVSSWLYVKVKNHGTCEDAENMELKIEYKGIVAKKYIDKANHSFKIVEIINKNHVKQEMMDWDESGLYEFVEVGDSIVKELNTLEVEVFRNNKRTSFLIDYGCSD